MASRSRLPSKRWPQPVHLVLLKWCGVEYRQTFNNPTAILRPRPAPHTFIVPARGALACLPIAFSGAADRSRCSSLAFYDFDNDTIYVGDDSGRLRKFTGAFNGTPTQVTTGGFPATLTAGNVVDNSPVFDGVQGEGSSYRGQTTCCRWRWTLSVFRQQRGGRSLDRIKMCSFRAELVFRGRPRYG